MSTSQTTFLSKPTNDDPIPEAVLAYIKARGRQQAYNLIVAEFRRSGITQATLARRLDKGTDLISRLLKRPGNWEQDTISEFLFAISGGSFGYRVEYPTVTTGNTRQQALYGGRPDNSLGERLLETNSIRVSPPDRTAGTARRTNEIERAS